MIRVRQNSAQFQTSYLLARQFKSGESTLNANRVQEQRNTPGHKIITVRERAQRREERVIVSFPSPLV